MIVSLLRFLILSAACCLPAVAPPVVFAADELTITVAKGDTLLSLCDSYLERPAQDCRQLVSRNHLKNPNFLAPGQQLTIPVALLKITPVAGKVTFLKGDVSMGARAGGVRHQLVAGEQITAGNRIVTGSGGSLEVSYADGSSFLVRPNSTVDVVRSLKQGEYNLLRNIFLQAGELINRLKKATGMEQRYQIETPSAVAGARGTEFRVGVDASQATRTEVLEGVVGLDAAGRGVVLEQLEGSVARKGEAPSAPRKLLPSPELRDVPPLLRELSWQLAYVPLPGAASYRALLARDIEMKDLVQDVRVPPGGMVSLMAPEDGVYYVQLTAFDTLGLEGVPSAPRIVTVRSQPGPPVLTTPVGGAVVRGHQAEFSWQGSGVSGYRLQVAPDPAFVKPVIDERVSGTQRYQAAILPPGALYWRVAAIAKDGFEGSWTSAHPFMVQNLPSQPRLASPDVQGKQVYLTLATSEPGVTYRFQAAKDDQFSQVVVDETTDKAGLVFATPEAAGRYWVRCMGLNDAEQLQSAWSEVGDFTVEEGFPYGKLGIGLGALALLLGLLL